VHAKSLYEIDLSHSCIPAAALTHIINDCIGLEKLVWEGSPCSFEDPEYFTKECRKLKEVYIDGSILYCHVAGMPSLLVAGVVGERNIERLSIKNCRASRGNFERLSIMDCRASRGFELSQDAIIQFVRETPSLKWLRSDLTPKNVAMMEAERPDVTFEG
jgi:hypothetical protein